MIDDDTARRALAVLALAFVVLLAWSARAQVVSPAASCAVDGEAVVLRGGWHYDDGAHEAQRTVSRHTLRLDDALRQCGRDVGVRDLRLDDAARALDRAALALDDCAELGPPARRVPAWAAVLVGGVLAGGGYAAARFGGLGPLPAAGFGAGALGVGAAALWIAEW